MNRLNELGLMSICCPQVASRFGQEEFNEQAFAETRRQIDNIKALEQQGLDVLTRGRRRVTDPFAPQVPAPSPATPQPVSDEPSLGERVKALATPTNIAIAGLALGAGALALYAIKR